MTSVGVRIVAQWSYESPFTRDRNVNENRIWRAKFGRTFKIEFEFRPECKTKVSRVMAAYLNVKTQFVQYNETSREGFYWIQK